MAEHILETRIQLRYGTYVQWMNSDVILKVGEAAVASFPNNRTIEGISNSTPENTPPAIGIKIGDGRHYFSELPWVQGIAADVYSWAKQLSKPEYSANEITGLDSYIEEHAPSGPGDGTVAPRIYQITHGNGSQENRYYLRYKESADSNDWITDTTHYIDLSDFVKVAEWIGSDVDNYGSLANRTEQHIQYDLGLINTDDSEQEGKVVTSVSQNNAKITVTKKTLQFNDISGVLPVEKGGTGKNEFESGEVLVGNGTNAIRTIPIDTAIDTNNHLATNYAIKTYVDRAVSGLEGAMHFVGDASNSPLTSRNAGINNYSPTAGDVVLWEQKEYVWTGSSWRLLGDEGSYAVKGSIKDADIDNDANIQQSKIYNLAETFAEKVDKEQGKQLSSNDYTDDDKQKLAGIEPGAQVNVIEHILLNEVEVPAQEINNMQHTVALVVKEFDDDSKDKLATIEEGANVNSINGIKLNGNLQSPDNNKIVDLIINEFTTEDKTKLDSIEAGAQVNIIESISVNNTPVYPDQNKRIDLHLSEITPEQAEKLATIETGAQVNVIEGITVDTVPVYPNENKIVNIVTDPHTEHENKIEHIFLNENEVQPDNTKTVNLRIKEFDSNAEAKLSTIQEGAEVNAIQSIIYDNQLIRPDDNRAVIINPDPHTEHENKIEQIFINGREQTPNEDKQVMITINQDTLNLDVIAGARVPGLVAGEYDDVSTTGSPKKLELARVAKTGLINDLSQTNDTYFVIYCGSSTEVV